MCRLALYAVYFDWQAGKDRHFLGAVLLIGHEADQDIREFLGHETEITTAAMPMRLAISIASARAIRPNFGR